MNRQASISSRPIRILCLSNGHGEDAIALRILRSLQRHPSRPDVAALPIVGVGQAYRDQGVPMIGPTRQLPSGGFIYMDQRQLLRDVRGGLLGLTWQQLQVVRQWAAKGGHILAVGDIVPLAFAWLSGASYCFVGTAKSEYYLQDEAGRLPRQSWFENLEGLFGSVYLPWERWMMAHRRCRAVFPRDRLTTNVLNRFSIPAYDLGNPMMDGLDERTGHLPHYPKAESDRPLIFTLLPGSRIPEAYDNWQQIMQIAQVLCDRVWQRPLVFLGAIAPSLDLEVLKATLPKHGWRLKSTDPFTATQRKSTLLLTQSAYADCLHTADVAIAMAGTATEQFIGLGKPAITIAGKGPQFTPAFAEAQTRLLGPSVILIQKPDQAVQVIHQLLDDPDRLQIIAENGKRRMGTAGAADRIADRMIQAIAESNSAV